MKRYLLVDVGSTTTKAIYATISEEGAKFLALADAPTTVEAPAEDVQIGLEHALSRIQVQLDALNQQPSSGDQPALVLPHNINAVDGFLLTSSAGGGLQMLVIGLVRGMTGESAERAALGAGGVILDVLAQDDQRLPFERVRRIRELHPDMILLAGGVEGGAVLDVASLAELLFHANPESRFSKLHKLPLIYAGNSDLHPYLEQHAMGFDLQLVPNLRPTLDREELGPTRRVIQEQFMEHVMAHAPGYGALRERASAAILPTPQAVTRSVHLLSEYRHANILAVDIGGATTDIFSIVNQDMQRSVSANLGMSYSATNVLKEAGVAQLLRWLPPRISERELRDWLHNKMLRPTTLPHSEDALLVEQVLAREALRLGLAQHFRLTLQLKGNKPEGDWRYSSDDFFGDRQRFSHRDIDIIIGSGGVISHAPQATQAAEILIDAFLPVGWTELLLDRHFSLPHIGTLAQVDPEGALALLLQESLTPLGGLLVPKGGLFTGSQKVTIEPDEGEAHTYVAHPKTLTCIPLDPKRKYRVTIPAAWNMDFGAGLWRGFVKEGVQGSAGLYIDLRGRPLPWGKDQQQNRINSSSWRVHLAPAAGKGGN
ncbi:MAG: glutamate mutase L [Symbiobacteriaceae bacterium]|nr:glutamate mutase L [Symbiobacteriaceae bacterium]